MASQVRLTGFSRWFSQYADLTKKHFTLAWRNPRSTLAQVFVGALVCCLLAIFQAQANYILSVHTLHEPESLIPGIPLCVSGKVSQRPFLPYNEDGTVNGYAHGCTTLMYLPDSNSTRTLMSAVAAQNGLRMDVDILPVPGSTTQAQWDGIASGWVNGTLFTQQDDGVCTTARGTCDINPLQPDCIPCAFAMDNRTVTEWQLAWPNSTQNLVWIFGAYTAGIGPGVKADTSYSISYNQSITLYPWFADAHTASVKLALDKAILSSITQAASPSTSTPMQLDVSLKPYPKPKNRISGFDVFAQSGPQWMFVVPSVLFFHFLTELVAEKESKLRVSMRQMGLSRSAYWAAWATYALLAAAVSTCILTASGNVAGFAWFRGTNSGVVLSLYFLFALSMVGVAVLCSAFISSTKTAQTTAFTVAIVGFVFTAIISSGYGGLLDLMYSTEVYPWVVQVRRIIQVLPPYQLARAFSDIAALSAAEIDFQTQTVTQGPGFHWSDLYNPTVKNFFGFVCNLPAPVQAWWALLASTILYSLLGVYMDAVLPGPQGSPAHPLFFLGYTYKLRVSAGEESRAEEEARLGAEGDTQGEGVGVQAERDASSAPSSSYAVRVHKLKVVYRKGWSAFLFALTGLDLEHAWRRAQQALGLGDGHGGRGQASSSGDLRPTESAGRGQGDVIAVQDMSLVVRQHEIVALLGHNGAGKTTTISVLTGLITATTGAAEVAGYDVSTAKGLEQAQNQLGVCPQHDLLWPQLNARETLQLFCAIKGVPYQARRGEIDRVLKLVALTEVAQRAVGGFSGGMKRRLSVAIAALGSPAVMVLDEPTTGMDIVHKQEVWRLMEGLRATSAVILTTHSMEEAGTLADRVAIMAAGRLVACETPLRLKSSLGEGYRLSLVLKDSKDETLETVRARVLSHIPAARLTLRDATSVSFTIPFSDASSPAMPALLHWCDEVSASAQGEGQGALLEDYGVSGPDLESVFVKVSAAAKFGLAQAALDVDHHHADEEEEEAGAGVAGLGQAVSAGTTGYSPLHPQSSSAANDATRTPPSRSLVALCSKNLTLIVRQRGLCCCQIMTPLVVLALLLVLRYIIKVEAGTSSITLVPSITVPLNLNVLSPIAGSGSEADTEGGMVVGARVNMSRVDVVQELKYRVWLQPGSALLPAGYKPDLVQWPYYLSIPPSEEGEEEVAWDDGADDAGEGQAEGRMLQSGGDDDDPTTKKELLIPDCVLFFLYAIQPTSPGATAAGALATAVGSFRQVHWHAGKGKPTPPPPATAANAKGFLSHIPSGWCKMRNGTLVPAPYWDSRIDLASAGQPGYDPGSQIDLELDAVLNQLNGVDVNRLLAQPPCWPNETVYNPAAEAQNCPAYLLPDGVVLFHALSAPVLSEGSTRQGQGQGGAYQLSYTLMVNDVTVNTNYHRPNNFSRALFVYGANVSSPLTIDPAKLGLMDELTRAYVAWANLSGAEQNATLGLPTIVAVSTMPFLNVVNLLQIVEIIGGVLHTIVLTLPLPLFVFLPVLEKSEKLLDLQRAMGMRLAPYIAVNYGLNFAIYSTVAGVYWAASAALSFKFFTQTDPTLLAAIIAGYGLALVSISNLLSAFLWSRQAAVILGFTVALLGPLMATAIAAGIYGYSLPISIGGGMPSWYYALPIAGPIFAVTRALYLGTYVCLAKEQCYQSAAAALEPGTEMHACVAALYISALLYFIIALYLDQVLPRAYGVPKHPLFFVPEAWRQAAWARLTGAVDPPALPSAASAAVATRDDRAKEQGSLWSYISRWAGVAGASHSAAVAAFARGEDSDVYSHRELVQSVLWPAAVRAKAGAGAGADGLGAQDEEGQREGGKHVLQRYPVLIKSLRKEFSVPVSSKKSKIDDLGPSKGSVQGGGGRLLGEGEQPLLGTDGQAADERSMLSTDLDVSPDAPKYHETEQLVLGERGVKVAVSDVSLAIPAGACFGLLGENGAGKTTTINMLQGLFAPTDGSAFVCGYDIVKETDAVRLSLGICAQHDIYWPNLTVGEHLLYYARLKGIPHEQERAAVEAAAASVGLAGVANRYAHDLSGGMRRRMSLACALIGQNTGVVLLDEPSTGLDPASKRKLLRLIDSARRQGAAGGRRVFVLISHDLAEVETLASTVAIMTYGRVRCIGTPQQLKGRYGGGYVLQVAYDSSGAGGPAREVAARVEASLLALFPAAKVEARYLGSLTLSLPTKDPRTGQRIPLANAFSTLQTRASACGVTEWSITQPSLQAAFARIVKHYRVGNEQEEEEGFAAPPVSSTAQ